MTTFTSFGDIKMPTKETLIVQLLTIMVTPSHLPPPLVFPGVIAKDLFLGNWTRFVNHSCEANCVIEHVARRGKMLSVYRVTKDIAMFEEVTTNYGEGYFLGRGLKCLCDAEQHLHPLM